MKKLLKLNEDRLRAIVAESVKNVLLEAELLPNGTDNTAAKTAWMAISNALVNIQTAMRNREKEVIPSRNPTQINGLTHAISQNDVKEIVDYIFSTINNCLSSTLPNLMRK